MTDHTLTFQFQGICTHFRYGVAAGVPHRVVLPDAAHIQGGYLNIDGVTKEPVLYYFVPHFARLMLVGGGGDLTVPGLINQHGDIVSGVRLQVLNAIDPAMNYCDERVPSLSTFVPQYNFAADVVLGGRAACYLDLYGGEAWSEEPPEGSGRPLRYFIKVRTEGAPKLLVSPLLSSGQPGQSHQVKLPADPPDLRLFVKNLEPPLEQPSEELAGEFDYLLHYLTARGGIPETIARCMPGMPDNPKSVTPDRLALALEQLRRALLDSPRELVKPDDITPGCADSQYP